MRPLLILPLVLAFSACNPPESSTSEETGETPRPEPTPPAESIELVTAPVDIRSSVVRINATLQSWNTWQPWEKNSPRKRRALAAIVAPQRVLTTSELVADASYIEFESADGNFFCPAKVIAVDYEVNLALLGPASESEGDALFASSMPFEISNPPQIGGTLEILQIEDNGMAIQTPGTLQSTDLDANFLPNQPSLTYRVKASMQSAASSYSLPVLQDGALAGILTSYNSKDQICDVTATDIIARFLEGATNGGYTGFPSLGVSIARTEDSSFRQWLKLADDQGGLYIRTVRPGSAAENAGIQKGDVLLAVDGQQIDRRGYYEHPNYGRLSWGHLIRGEKSTGEVVKLSLVRDGAPLELEATLMREEEDARLVPNYLFGKSPNYLVKGGLVFQELSRPILEGFGEDWTSRAPLNLLDAYENPEKYQDEVNRIVFLSGVIPTPATVGYERLRNLVVAKVNGKAVKDIKSLIEAFGSNSEELHSIEFADENLTVHLDEAVSITVDSQLLQNGINKLSHTE